MYYIIVGGTIYACQFFFGLLYELKPDKKQLKRPIYLSLAEKLEQDITSGLLAPGTKLPPQRELADYLDINFTTITRAYSLCKRKGLIYAVTGSGTFVSPNTKLPITISMDNQPKNLIELGFIASFEQCNSMIVETVREISQKKYIRANALYAYNFSDIKKNEHPYSFHRWLPISREQNSEQIEAILKSKGIRVFHSDRFLTASNKQNRYLRIALSSTDSFEDLEKGLRI